MQCHKRKPKFTLLAFTVALPLIWTHPYDKTGIWGINHTCSQTQEVKKNVNIKSIKSLFFRFSLVTAKECANKFSHSYTHYSICMQTPLQLCN